MDRRLPVCAWVSITLLLVSCSKEPIGDTEETQAAVWSSEFDFHYYQLDPRMDYVTSGVLWKNDDCEKLRDLCLLHTGQTQQDCLAPTACPAANCDLDNCVDFWLGFYSSVSVQLRRQDGTLYDNCDEESDPVDCVGEALENPCPGFTPPDGTCDASDYDETCLEEFSATMDDAAQTIAEAILSYENEAGCDLDQLVSAYQVVFPTSTSDLMVAYRGPCVDSVYVEAYEGSAWPTGDPMQSYNNIYNKLEAADGWDLEDKVFLAMNLRNWASGKMITTPNELRRQLHFVRYNYEDYGTDGLRAFSFYNTLKHDITPGTVNREIERFFVAPVLRVELDGNDDLIVKNIGASDQQISFSVVCGSQSATVGALNSGSSTTVTNPYSTLPCDLKTEFKNGYTVLADFDLIRWDEEDPVYRTNASAGWPNGGTIAWQETHDFSTNPGVTQSSQTSVPEGASGLFYIWPFGQSQSCDESLEVSFSMETGASMRKANWIEVGIVGTKSQGERIKMRLKRPEMNSTTNSTFRILAEQIDGKPVFEDLPVTIDANDIIEVELYYEKDTYIRARVVDNAGVLWDTGEVPVDEMGEFHNWKLGVRNHANSDIDYDSQNQDLDMTSYTYAGYMYTSIDDLTITCYQ